MVSTAAQGMLMSRQEPARLPSNGENVDDYSVIVDLDAGNDIANIKGVQARNVYLTAGEGNDKVRMKAVNAANEFKVHMEEETMSCRSPTPAMNPFFDGGDEMTHTRSPQCLR